MGGNTSNTTHFTNSIIPHLVIFILLLLSPPYLAVNILYSGEALYAENYLEYGSYIFRMQSDCNLVLYDNAYLIWASNTGGVASGCYCTLQSDGNLVVYEQNGTPIWATNTGRDNGYYVLILQQDRNIVIYGTATWATATNAVNAKIDGCGGGVSVINLVSENEHNGTKKLGRV